MDAERAEATTARTRMVGSFRTEVQSQIDALPAAERTPDNILRIFDEQFNALKTDATNQAAWNYMNTASAISVREGMIDELTPFAEANGLTRGEVVAGVLRPRR